MALRKAAQHPPRGVCRVKSPTDPSWLQCFCLPPPALPTQAETAPAQCMPGHHHPGCSAVLPVVLSAAAMGRCQNPPLPLTASALHARAECGDPWARRTRGQELLVALTGFGQHDHLVLGKAHLAHGASEFLYHTGFHCSVSAFRDRDVAAAWPNVPKPPPSMGAAPGALWVSHTALPEHPAPQHPRSSGTVMV